MKVRVALGSLAVLGLERLEMLEAPSTLYVLQYSERGCNALCAFCPQSAASRADKSLVSRVPWPAVDLDTVASALRSRKGAFERICIQTVLKPEFENELLAIVETLRNSAPSTPISVATTPLPRRLLEELKETGVERLGVGLDVASPRVIERVHKPFTWEEYLEFVREAVEVFGRRRVHVHLIFGLGESESEILSTMQMLYDLGAEIALFAFTPIPGTPMAHHKPPPIERYRVIQVARYLISKGYRVSDFAEVGERGTIAIKCPQLKDLWRAFLTSGCPGCNRPFYNERPRLIYNYPSIRLLKRNINVVRRQAEKAGLMLPELGLC